MKLFLSSGCVIMMLACGVPQRPSTLPAPQRDLGLAVRYDRRLADLTLDIVHPAYVIVIEQRSGGFSSLMPFDSTTSMDQVPAGVYRFNVLRDVAAAAAPRPPHPSSPPCFDYRP